jgi:flagellar hook-length control protein FliK
MMSAKTVLTETQAPSLAPAAPNNAGGTATSGGPPSDFQNVLEGVGPIAAETPIATAATQPLMELLKLKNAQLAAAASAGAATQPGKVAKPAVSPADLLKILNDSSALLPHSPDVAAVATEGPDTDIRDSDEPAVADSDILAEWLDVMLPSSVFAPQAGSANAAGASVSVQGEGEAAARAGTAPGQLPASLIQQAGLPELQESMDAAPTAQGAAATFAVNREALATATQTAAAAFAAALTGSAETGEGEAPTNDSWMSAMGDLTSKRSADLAPSSEARLPTPVHDARWADALAHRLVLMAREGESVASLKLVPVDLGPLDIQISVRDGEASVHFGAAHAETRAVLESSMPRLRELLMAQGLQLTDASVSHQSPGQNRPERSSATGSASATGEESEATAVKVISTSLLDIYA